ncbi:MAG: hypothetical protein ACK46X_00535 [Candidatus Sericytochromatia bacterium]
MRNTATPIVNPVRLGHLAVAAAVLTGCVSQPTPTNPITAEGELRHTITGTNGGKLINEGGPVFALPGTIRMPAYFAGDPATLTVRAERLDGGAFPKVEPAPVSADGSFTLKGPITSQLFFATTEFTAQDGLHRMRTLARAQAGEPIILDTASTLVGAKVALAAQKRSLDDLSYVATTEVTSQVRSVLATNLDAVKLDKPNEQLAQALTDAAAKHETLATSLRKWEQTLLPASPTPGPSPKPSAQPTTAGSAEPVK